MGYDAVVEMKLQEFRMNNLKGGNNIFNSYDKPDMRKWGRKDCLKCYVPFSAVRRGSKYKCLECGAEF